MSRRSNLASLKTIFAGLSEFAALVDADGAVLHVNAAGLRLLDRAADELAGAQVERLSPALREAIAAAAASGAWEGDGELLRGDGEPLPVALTLAPIDDTTDDGAAATLVSIVARAVADVPDELVQQHLLRREMLAATSTPIIQVWDEIVTMPVVGLVDSMRAADMKNALLDAVARSGARFAIVDLTGVDTVDTATADHLLRVMRAVRLLGARCVITGIQPAVAQIVVSLGVDMAGVVTLRSLREGLRFCLRRLGFRITRETPAERSFADMTDPAPRGES